MIYAIFADIHGNLEALKKVLKELKNEKVEKYIFLGDIVGYGANPRECIDLIRKLEAIVIAGNHDWAAVEKFDINYFNPVAKEAILWTKKILTNDDKDYLASLKLTFEEDNFTAVHGSLDKPEYFRYIVDLYDAKSSLKLLKKDILFIGHSHVPFISSMKNLNMELLKEFSINLKTRQKYLVNVGSVGQPRDNNPKACYAIYDSKLNSIEIKRASYNIKKAQEKIINAGLPKTLAERLSFGM